MRPEDIVKALYDIKALLPITEEGYALGYIIDIIATQFTPLEPIQVNRYRSDAFISDGVLRGKCPRCRMCVTEEEQCCHKCGQLLDWSKYTGEDIKRMQLEAKCMYKAMEEHNSET